MTVIAHEVKRKIYLLTTSQRRNSVYQQMASTKLEAESTALGVMRYNIFLHHLASTPSCVASTVLTPHGWILSGGTRAGWLPLVVAIIAGWQVPTAGIY